MVLNTLQSLAGMYRKQTARWLYKNIIDDYSCDIGVNFDVMPFVGLKYTKFQRRPTQTGFNCAYYIKLDSNLSVIDTYAELNH